MIDGVNVGLFLRLTLRIAAVAIRAADANGALGVRIMGSLMTSDTSPTLRPGFLGGLLR